MKLKKQKKKKHSFSILTCCKDSRPCPAISQSHLDAQAQMDARLTGDQKVAGSTPTEVGNILSWRFDHEIFFMVILSLPLTQEWQLSVSG